METKDDAPKPNQKEIQKKYILKDSSNSNYTLNLIFNLEQLIIEIEQDDSLPILFYKSAFILSEVQKKDKWFRQFDSFLESFEVINGLFEDNKVTIINENNNKINLIISHLEKKIPDSKFVLEKKDFEEKDIISSLVDSCNNLRKRIKFLEDENKNLNEMIINITSIPIINKYLNKIQRKFLDGIINNENDQKLIFSWINENKKISAKLIYSATIDGDDSNTFHNLCDNVGPTLVLVKTTNNQIFGGYTKENWKSTQNYKNDTNAFIFSLNKKAKANSSNGNSIYCNTGYGPTFGGGHDLYISSGCLNNNSSYNNTNNTYKIGGNYFLAGQNNFICKEVEVYSISENN